MKEFYGFITGSNFCIKNSDKKFLLKQDEGLVDKFEKKVQQVLNFRQPGISFAAARMCLLNLLLSLNLKPKDEVIMLGFSCYAVAEAIIVSGARPVYSDIDMKTLGSELNSISKLITKRTKVVIAQHSFGIPCRIQEIRKLCNENNLFLVEDCALVFNQFSHTNAEFVGKFGDASIFSFDHTKPINSIIGGIIFCEDNSLRSKVLEKHRLAKPIDVSMKSALINQVYIEQKYYNPEKYSSYQWLQYLYKLFSRITFKPRPFFLEVIENHNDLKNLKNRYSSILPTSSAYIGTQQLNSWHEIANNRKKLFYKILKIVKESHFDISYPQAYDFEPDLHPCRFVFFTEDQELLLKLSKLVELKDSWFDQPIISPSRDLKKYGYNLGDCPNSENVCKKIYNIPSNLAPQHHDNFLRKLSEVLL